MTTSDRPVIIVGGGIAGLACAHRLHQQGLPWRIIEASGRPGGRIKTDHQAGYRLDRGFQVLQTAYPEAQRSLDFSRLNLRCFAPGAMIRMQGRIYTVADPLRRPQALFDTLRAPIGSFTDRLRLLRLAYRVCRGPIASLFRYPETTSMDFLRAQGFSRKMIERFFVPFFGGVCLDPHIQASSRVLMYVLRMFASGEAAIPMMGMEEIPKQLAAGLPAKWVQTGTRIQRVGDARVVLKDGGSLPARAVVIATEGPETARLLGRSTAPASVAETCLYFACKQASWHNPFLILNGEGRGPINNVVFPSQVSPAYAPAGKSLVSVVVLGNPNEADTDLIERVRVQLTDWFGSDARRWEHLKTYRIDHALPDQRPPTQNPFSTDNRVRPGVFVCGEFFSLPGIQWALASGRRAAEDVWAYLRTSP